MSEFNKLLEQIRQSDIKIGALSREIRDLVTDIKKAESDISCLTSKLEQLRQENKYKMKMSNEKELELKMIKWRFDVLQEILTQKKQTKMTEEAKLDCNIQAVWNVRSEFCDDVAKFLDENDYIMYGSQKIQAATYRKDEEKALDGEISELKKEIEELKEELSNCRKTNYLLERLKQERDHLMKEPDVGSEFLRLKSRIQECFAELEDLNEVIARHESKVGVSQWSNVRDFTQDNSLQHENTLYQETSRQSFLTPFRPQLMNTGKVQSQTFQIVSAKKPFVPKGPNGLSRDSLNNDRQFKMYDPYWHH